MKYIYYAVSFGTAIFFAFIVGNYVGKLKCNSRIANMNTVEIISTANMVENVNEKVFHTSLGDIRRVLREKYTIAE